MEWDLKQLSTIMEELQESEAWVHFWRHLQEMKEHLEMEVWEATSWENILEARGAKRMLDAIMYFKGSIRDQAQEILEERNVTRE